MKNIHVLPTSQPSNLLLCIKSYIEHKDTPAENSDNKGNFTLGLGVYANKMFYQPHHIYITSTEEIKEGDWCYNSITNKIYRKLKGNFAFAYEYKIILTTDGDLIKKGVQTIDDDFLEWFVNNSSVDEVEVSYGVLKPFQSADKGYMIHLPDNDVLEEPKTKCYCGHTTYCDCGPEQELDILEVPMPIYKETLEEAAEEYGISVGCDNGTAGVDFIACAKYQQEQDKKMYSELVDLLERLATIYIDDCDLDIKYDKKRLEFIEQLKKK